jgi:membrane protein YdbS with pleckstrin-like domain
MSGKQVQATAPSSVLWVGRPWVVPRLAGMTIAILAIGLACAWAEFRSGMALTSFLHVPLIGITFFVLGFVWLLGALDLAILRASHKYVLRGSSLDIGRGILTRRIFTISDAGFSDLEVVQGIGGRILNMGNIVIETDSKRDLKLIMIHDPTEAAAKIRQVMTTPMVRIAPEIAALSGQKR